MNFTYFKISVLYTRKMPETSSGLEKQFHI